MLYCHHANITVRHAHPTPNTVIAGTTSQRYYHHECGLAAIAIQQIAPGEQHTITALRSVPARNRSAVVKPMTRKASKHKADTLGSTEHAVLGPRGTPHTRPTYLSASAGCNRNGPNSASVALLRNQARVCWQPPCTASRRCDRLHWGLSSVLLPR